jgi:hypothetical protein
VQLTCTSTRAIPCGVRSAVQMNLYHMMGWLVRCCTGCGEGVSAERHDSKQGPASTAGMFSEVTDMWSIEFIILVDCGDGRSSIDELGGPRMKPDVYRPDLQY